jgi:hypothetical protein
MERLQEKVHLVHVRTVEVKRVSLLTSKYPVSSTTKPNQSGAYDLDQKRTIPPTRPVLCETISGLVEP